MVVVGVVMVDRRRTLRVCSEFVRHSSSVAYESVLMLSRRGARFVGSLLTKRATGWSTTSTSTRSSYQTRASSSSSSSGDSLAECERLSLRRRFTDEDVRAFGAVSGDENPIHYEDGGDGRGDRLGGRVVHGMLSASVFGALLSRAHPGAVYATQELKFRAPVRVGEEIEAMIRLTRKSGTRARYETVVRRVECGTVCVDGTALALLPE